MRVVSLISSYCLGCRTEKGFTLQNSLPKAEILSHSDGDSVLEVFKR